MMNALHEGRSEILALSLLHPDGKKAEATCNGNLLDRTARIDLGYDDIIREMEVDEDRRGTFVGIATLLCTDPEVIRYRQDVLVDCMRNEALISWLEELLPYIRRLQYYVMHPGKTDATPLQETAWRLRELENYVKCVDGFQRAFQDRRITVESRGLKAFREIIRQIVDDPAYAELKNELPGLLRQIDTVKSITVGINLNDGLTPVEAALLSIHDTPFRESRFLGTVTASYGQQPVGKLHTARNSEFHGDPAMVPLLRDVSNMLKKTMKPVSAALKRFGRVNGLFFVGLMDEFLFYLGGIKLIRRMQACGMPMSRPEIKPADERIFEVAGMYNLHLALRHDDPGALVLNHFSMSARKRIFILTGPNSGGKTTFLQGVGLVQILAQLGFFVPAREAVVSICDNVYTHYPNLEDPNRDTGRFGEEAERLQQLFGKISGASIVLLNETLSSTSMGEAIYLAQDMLHVIGEAGARVVFATHLHQLASDLDSLTDGLSDDAEAESIVAGVEQTSDGEVRPNFVVRPGPPLGKSYAADLAKKYGIGREQLMALVGSG